MAFLREVSYKTQSFVTKRRSSLPELLSILCFPCLWQFDTSCHFLTILSLSPKVFHFVLRNFTTQSADNANIGRGLSKLRGFYDFSINRNTPS